MTDREGFRLFISFSQNRPSLPVLMELLKFISNKIMSKSFSVISLWMLSGFVSVSIVFTSIFSKKRTAVRTSLSSSTISIFAWCKFIITLVSRLQIYQEWSECPSRSCFLSIGRHKVSVYGHYSRTVVLLMG